MKELMKVLELTDEDLLLDEIKERIDLRDQMVGSLYPGILDREIDYIKDRIDFLLKQAATEKT